MRIFVGGLPRTATKEDVVRLFRQFGAGEDDVVLPRDRKTRRRKGFAYVEIGDAQRAKAAIVTFANFEVDGKMLTVCAADDRPPKRARRKLIIAFAILSASIGAMAQARADQTPVDIGLTLNPIIGGMHESFDDREHVPPVPIPLLEVRARHGPFELDLQGLPQLASVHAFDAIQGTTSTRLSIFEGVLRVWDPLHRYSIGIGQTLYSQSTHYTDSVEIAGTGETQFSRVTGINYQAGYGVPYHRGRFEAVFNYVPVMLGTQYTLYDLGFFHGRADPERAEQIDTALRFTHPLGTHGDVILGLRYVNYTSHYAERGGGLADRNVGVLPVIGYRTRLGH
jgi:hypothetical protein